MRGSTQFYSAQDESEGALTLGVGYLTIGIETMLPRRDVFGRVPFQFSGPVINDYSVDQPWTPGPIGLNDRANKLFANGGPGRKSSKSSKRSKKTKILNVVTDFPNPWKGKIKEEIEALQNNRWAPSIDDFEALVNKSYTVNHFHQLLGLIVTQPKASIMRINIFTHSNSDLIAFKGTISPKSTFASVSLEVNSALSLQMLQSMTSGTWFQVGKSKKKHTINDISKHFASGAKVFIYSCKSATDPVLLQELADKFGVITVGFKDNICYCPMFTANSIDRKRVGLGKACSGKSNVFSAIDGKGTQHKPSNP